MQHTHTHTQTDISRHCILVILALFMMTQERSRERCACRSRWNHSIEVESRWRSSESCCRLWICVCWSNISFLLWQSRCRRERQLSSALCPHMLVWLHSSGFVALSYWGDHLLRSQTKSAKVHAYANKVHVLSGGNCAQMTTGVKVRVSRSDIDIHPISAEKKKKKYRIIEACI